MAWRELSMCLSDIATELNDIHIHFWLAWQQAERGRIDIVQFLLAMNRAYNNLCELTHLYFEHEWSNEELYFQYKYFLGAWMETINLISRQNEQWHMRHELLFKNIGLQAEALARTFQDESDYFSAMRV